jgi:hypothetical protein
VYHATACSRTQYRCHGAEVSEIEFAEYEFPAKETRPHQYYSERGEQVMDKQCVIHRRINGGVTWLNVPSGLALKMYPVAAR